MSIYTLRSGHLFCICLVFSICLFLAFQFNFTVIINVSAQIMGLTTKQGGTGFQVIDPTDDATGGRYVELPPQSSFSLGTASYDSTSSSYWLILTNNNNDIPWLYNYELPSGKLKTKQKMKKYVTSMEFDHNQNVLYATSYLREERNSAGNITQIAGTYIGSLDPSSGNFSSIALLRSNATLLPGASYGISAYNPNGVYYCALRDSNFTQYLIGVDVVSKIVVLSNIFKHSIAAMEWDPSLQKIIAVIDDYGRKVVEIDDKNGKVLKILKSNNITESYRTPQSIQLNPNITFTRQIFHEERSVLWNSAYLPGSIFVSTYVNPLINNGTSGILESIEVPTGIQLRNYTISEYTPLLFYAKPRLVVPTKIIANENDIFQIVGSTGFAQIISVDAKRRFNYIYRIMAFSPGLILSIPDSESKGLFFMNKYVVKNETIIFEGLIQDVNRALQFLQASVNVPFNGLSKIILSVALKIREDGVDDIYHDVVFQGRISRPPFPSTAYTVPHPRLVWDGNIQDKMRPCGNNPNAFRCNMMSKTLIDYSAFLGKAEFFYETGLQYYDDTKEIVLQILGINQAPSWASIPSLVVISPGSTLLLFSTFNEILTDPDFNEPFYADPTAASGPLSPWNKIMLVTIAVGKGLISLANPAIYNDPTKIKFLQGKGTTDKVVQFYAYSLADANNVLRGLQYTPSTEIISSVVDLSLIIDSDVIVFTANDKGNTGVGTELITTKQLSISINCKEADPPQLKDATIGDSGATIIITFDRNTDKGGISSVVNCAELLKEETTVLLGAKSLCSWVNQKQVMVLLGNGASILPGNLIYLVPQKVKACSVAARGSTGSVSLNLPVTKPIPQAAIPGASIFGFCENATFDASVSTGNGGRGFVSKWTLVNMNTVSNGTAIQAYLDTHPGIYQSIPSELISIGVTYTVYLQITNYLTLSNCYTSAQCMADNRNLFSFKKSDFPLPSLSLKGPPQRSYFRPLDNYIEGLASLSTCSGRSESRIINFLWKLTNVLPNIPALYFTLHDKTKTKKNLFIPANTFLVGYVYTFSLTIWIEGDSKHTVTESTVVTVVPSTVVSIILFGDRTNPQSEPVSLDASSSYDPDEKVGNTFSYSWSCLTLPTFDPCTTIPDKNPLILIQNATLSIPAYSFEVGDKFQFTVVVSLRDAVGGITKSSTNVAISIVDGKPPLVSIAALSKPKINATERLILKGSATSLVKNVVLMYAWSITQGDLDITAPGVVSTSINDRNLVISDWNTLSIPPATPLIPGQTYQFTLTAFDSNLLYGKGTSQITVVVNRPPSGGNFFASPNVGIATNTTFVLSAEQWTDDPGDLPLSYIFKYLNPNGEEIALSESILKNQISAVFPAGEAQTAEVILYCLISDKFQGITKAQTAITLSALVFTGAARAEFVASQQAGATGAALDRGDSDSAVQLADSLTSILNAPPPETVVPVNKADVEDPVLFAKLQAQQQATMATRAAEIATRKHSAPGLRGGLFTSVTSAIGQVEETSNTIDKSFKSVDKLTSATDEVDPSTVVTSLSFIGKMVGSSSRKGIQGSSGQAAGSGLANAMASTDKATTQVPCPGVAANSTICINLQNEFKAAAASSASSAITGSLATLTRSQLSIVVPGESPKNVTNDSIQMSGERSYPDKIANKAISTPVAKGRLAPSFTLPPNLFATSTDSTPTPSMVPTPSGILTSTPTPTNAVGTRTPAGRRRRLLSIKRLLAQASAVASAGHVDFQNNGWGIDPHKASSLLATTPTPSAGNVTGLDIGAGNSPLHIQDLQNPISIMMPTSSLPTNPNLSPACQYFDKVNLRWSSKGCVIAGINGNFTQCLCSHLSDFVPNVQNAVPKMNIINPIADASAITNLNMDNMLALIVTMLMFGSYWYACVKGYRKDQFEKIGGDVVRGRLVLESGGGYRWDVFTMVEYMGDRSKKAQAMVEAKNNARFAAMSAEDAKLEIESLAKQKLEEQETFDAELAKSGLEPSEGPSWEQQKITNDQIQTSANVCWVCLEDDDIFAMLTPCNCTGMLKHVHAKCLMRFQRQNNDSQWSTECPICSSEYDLTKKRIFRNEQDVVDSIKESVDEDVLAKEIAEKRRVDFDAVDMNIEEANLYKQIVYAKIYSCWVCLEEAKQINLIRPCCCEGMLKYCHEACFVRWTSTTKADKCDHCGKAFRRRKSGLIKRIKQYFEKKTGKGETEAGVVFQGSKMSRLQMWKTMTWVQIKFSHPLLFCIYIPPNDPFTRPQRFTVFFALVIASLITSAIFMGTGPPANLFQTIFRIVITTLVLFPAKFIFKGLFEKNTKTVNSFPSITSKGRTGKETPYQRQQRIANEKVYEMMNATQKVIAKVSGKAPVIGYAPPIKLSIKELEAETFPAFVTICAYIASYMFFGIGGFMIILYGISFSNMLSLQWLGMAFVAFVQDFLVSKPLSAGISGLIFTIQSDIKQFIKDCARWAEAAKLKIKALMELLGLGCCQG